MALVRVRNRDTGEVLDIGEEHLQRWPDDPYDRVEDTAPVASATPTTAPASPRDDHEWDDHRSPQYASAN